MRPWRAGPLVLRWGEEVAEETSSHGSVPSPRVSHKGQEAKTTGGRAAREKAWWDRGGHGCSCSAPESVNVARYPSKFSMVEEGAEGIC